IIMVEYANIEATNWHTTGFETTLVNGLVSIATGSVIMAHRQVDYDAIEFELEADAEIPVAYDVYLLGNGTQDVVRTEVGIDTLSAYEGEEELVHCLISLQIEPGETLSSLS